MTLDTSSADQPVNPDKLIDRHATTFAGFLFLLGVLVYILPKMLGFDQTIGGMIIAALGQLLAIGVAVSFLKDHISGTDREKLFLAKMQGLVTNLESGFDQVRSSVTDANAQIRQHVRTAIEVNSSLDREMLNAVMHDLAARASRIVMVGRIEPSEVQQLTAAHSTRLSVTVYLPWAGASALANHWAELRSEVAAVNAVAELGSARILIATDALGRCTDVLYLPQDESLMAGLHFTGLTAAAVGTSIINALSTARATPLTTYRSYEFLAQRYRDFLSEAADVAAHGVPMRGLRGLCAEMKRCLSESTKDLCVTHVAKGASIALLKDSIFQAWLDENYRAIEKRNLKITRIFIVPRADLENPILLEVAGAMSQRGVTVKIRCEERVREHDRELADRTISDVRDFSIYDGQRLIYIHRAPDSRADWYATPDAPAPEEAISARLTEQPELVAEYRTIFERLNSELHQENSVVETFEKGP